MFVVISDGRFVKKFCSNNEHILKKSDEEEESERAAYIYCDCDSHNVLET